MSAADKDKVIDNLSQRRELSEGAKALLADKAFQHCVLELRQRWFGQLMLIKHPGPEQDELVARLRAHEEMIVELGLLLTDYREALRRQQRA